MKTQEINLKGRSLISLKDWSPEEIQYIISSAHTEKKASKKGHVAQRFVGKTLALIFEKRSTRTRCAFETAFGEEGGHPVFLSNNDIQLGAKESVEDTARVLGRMFSAIEFRGFNQQTVEILAEKSGVPVYNGLTDSYHPTQALADIMTFEEVYGSVKGKTISYVGDGRNNVATSLCVICAKLGIHINIIAPKSLQPSTEFIDSFKTWAQDSGSVLTISSDCSDVKGSDALYTDVWLSMGEKTDVKKRKEILQEYQVNTDLMQKTENPSCIFLHCLPAVKGEEVTAEVIEGPQSKVWEQAENRKHTIKAIMLATL